MESPEETKQTDQSFTASHATPNFEQGLSHLLPKEVADHLPPEILMSLQSLQILREPAANQASKQALKQAGNLPRFCTQCGCTFREKDKFCGECGNRRE